jgi:hypothetical protein
MKVSLRWWLKGVFLLNLMCSIFFILNVIADIYSSGSNWRMDIGYNVFILPILFVQFIINYVIPIVFFVLFFIMQKIKKPNIIKIISIAKTTKIIIFILITIIHISIFIYLLPAVLRPY